MVQIAAGRLIADRYRLEHLIGQGGMGIVWAARGVLDGKQVALKFLRDPQARRGLRRRLLREARALRSVQHANLVRIHDVLELADETPVIVMDLLEGETLGAKLAREEKLGIAETAGILSGVASAIHAAHQKGIVHRDLKPENIFLERGHVGSCSVKVLDFGIAKLAAALGTTSDSSELTETGSAIGTPCYMAPEQGFGEKDVDHRADIWALGIILYECLSGGRPVEGANLGQVLKRLLYNGITPLDRVAPDVPAEVAELVGRMLKQDREERLADLSYVYDVLARHAGDTPLSGSRPAALRRRTSPRKAFVAVAAIAAISSGYVLHRSHSGGSAAVRVPARLAFDPIDRLPKALENSSALSAAVPASSASAFAVSAPAGASVPRASANAQPMPHRERSPAARRARPADVPDTASARPGLIEKPPF